VVVTRQWGSRFLRVLPSLVEDLLDVVGRSYDGVDYVVLDDVNETILDPGESGSVAKLNQRPVPPLFGRVSRRARLVTFRQRVVRRCQGRSQLRDYSGCNNFGFPASPPYTKPSWG
jgi:hypothetical protein